MRYPFFLAASSLVGLGLVLAACAQPAAPSPTAPPAAPAKATEPAKTPAEPAKAAVAAPATLPAATAKTVDFPQKGRAISLIVPYAPGGSTDVSARMVAPVLEKELGTSVQVVNKPGGGSIVGNTEVANSKPDGYTVAYAAMPTIITSYLDPQMKATYNRKSFEPVARTTVNTIVWVTKSDGPFKTMKDLIDAAKAKPGTVKVAASGIGSVNHLPVLMIEKQAGVQFATVHFDGSAPGITALLGGHVDAASALEPEVVSQVKAGDLRVIGVADSQASKVYPTAPTMESQGYKIYMYSTHFVAAPAGTPKDVVNVLSGAVKRVLDDQELSKKLVDVGLIPRYLDPTQFGAFWDQSESEIRPLMEAIKAK